MTHDAFVILDPFSSGVAYAAEAAALGMVPVVVRTYEPPQDAPIRAFLPPRRYDDLDLPVDHHSMLFREADALTTESRRLAESLQFALHQRNCRAVGVVAGSELSVAIADMLASFLNLPGNDPSTALACRHKGYMKDHARASSVAVATHIEASTPEQMEEFCDQYGAPTDAVPMFVKPPCGGGSTRVRKCRSRGELDARVEEVAASGDFFGFRAGLALVETFVSGNEFAVNVFCDGQRAVVTDVWRYDRQDLPGVSDFGNNAYVSAVLVRPTEPEFAILARETVRIVDAFRRRFGPLHVEVKLEGSAVRLIEIGSRLSGGGLPALVARISGWNVLEQTVALLSGRAVRQWPGLTGNVGAAIVHGNVNKGGVVRQLRGLDAIWNLPTRHAWHVDHLPRVGSRVRATEDTSTSPLLVDLIGAPDEVQRDVAEVVRRFAVDVDECPEKWRASDGKTNEGQ